MLLWLLMIRFCPFVILGFLKERKQIKQAVIILGTGYVVGILIATVKIIVEEKWLAVIYVPLSMFPHYICYGFALKILIRCLWYAWSERVWKRIHALALMCVFAGVFMEKYLNDRILQIFFKIFK